jgi:hypothetical protein
MPTNPKVRTKYESEDIAQIIADMFRQLESPEGEKFGVVHILNETVMLRITAKTFIVNISEKDKLS